MTRLSDPAQLSGLLGIPFSDQQLAAITAPLEPGVIIAGAGSGKTTVMAARVVWLVGSGAVLPEQVLGLTFTRKAAAELSGRVRAALVRAGLAEDEAEPGEELVATYDSFAGRLVAEYGLLLGIEPGLRTLTGAGRFRLAAQAVADPPAALQSLTRLRPASVAALVVEFSAELGSHLVEPADLDQHAERFLTALDQAPRNRTGAEYAALAKARAITAERRELASLVTRYEELKAERGYVEFADQLAQAARLATELPSVQRALRAEFGVVLLDEYQDTSAAQARLLRGLFSGPDPRHGRGHPVTAVGDPCQAIYGWRGAAASNILQFATDFPTAAGTPARAYALTVNRRSGQRVLTAANALAAAVRDIPELAATGLDLELVCPAGTPAARIETAEFATWPQEMAWLADQVVGQHDAGEVEHWSDIAVLTRRNAQIAAVYAELVSRGVPVEIVGLGGLLDLPAVAEVVATLRLVADPCDNPALVRLLTSPRWAIGPADLTLLGSRARQLAGRPQAPDDPTVDDAVRAVLTGADPAAQPSLLEAVESPGDAGYSAAARQRFAAFSAEFAGLRRSASESVVDLVRRIIDTLGVEVELLAQGEDPAPLATFVRAVADFVELEDASTLPGLLAWLEDERDHGVGLEQAVVSAADSVKLLTVHKAKGLEWEVVFLPALAAGVFPGDRVTGNWLTNAAVLPAPLRGDAAAVPQLAEVSNAGVTGFGEALKQDNRLGEDRLAYVAVTRARRRLYGSSHAWDEGLTRPRQPSAYLAVLHEHADHRLLPEAVPDQNPLAPDGGGSPWPVVDDGERWQQRRRAA
ncbi:MAG: ATP-dependent helicase, partial [Propionicimonas sp.]|nr:ATP-dependent helicase [Propionicimonas sp.]